MQVKSHPILFMTALLLACKPSAQATTQPSSATALTTSKFKEGTAANTPLENLIADEDKEWRKGKAEGISEAFYSCIKQNNYATPQVSNCASDEKYLQDARLNLTYKNLIDLSNNEQKKALVDAQRSWLAWKNKEEMFEAAIYSSEQMDNAELEVREMNRLAQRADELDHYKASVELRAK